MPLSDLLDEVLGPVDSDCWDREQTATPVRTFAVRLHPSGLSLRETAAILDPLGVDRSHGAVWGWTHRLADNQADPPRSALQQVAVDDEKKWLYAAIDTNSKLLLDIEVFSRRGIDPASAFLHRLTSTHDVLDAEFLVDAGRYLTALARHESSGHLDYSERNLIKKLFQTVTMRIDHFYSFWRGSPANAVRWLRRFKHHYNHDRPNQALDGRTPTEEVLK